MIEALCKGDKRNENSRFETAVFGKADAAQER
jgi:hypothetical protein